MDLGTGARLKTDTRDSTDVSITQTAKFPTLQDIKTMLTIRREQMDALARDVVQRYVAATTEAVELRMRKEQPALTVSYGDSLHVDIAEAVWAAERLGVEDQDQIYDWCVVRIASRQPFYSMHEFSDVLDHPFLTPFAKARHIIMAFFSAAALQRGIS